MVLFGQTVVVTLPSGDGSGEDDDAVRRRWMDFIDARTKHVFLEHREGPAIQLQFDLDSETAAKRLEQELQGYFSTAAAGENIIPPWDPEDVRTPEDRERHRKAQQTYLRLEKVNQEVYDDKADHTGHSAQGPAHRQPPGRDGGVQTAHSRTRSSPSDASTRHEYDAPDPDGGSRRDRPFRGVHGPRPRRRRDYESSSYDPSRYDAYQRGTVKALRAVAGHGPRNAPNAHRGAIFGQRPRVASGVEAHAELLDLHRRHRRFADVFQMAHDRKGGRNFKYNLEHLRYESLSEGSSSGSGGDEDRGAANAAGFDFTHHPMG